MAARPFIVLGDQTDHGGVVIEASVMTDTHGKGIARVGDQVTCPKRNHGTTVIVTGDPTMIIDGKPAARHGDKCACGATLISSQFVSTVGDGASSGAQTSSSQAQRSAATAGVFAAYVEHPTTTTAADDDLEYFFVAERDDGRPVPLAYRINGDEGKLHEGRLGHNGETKAFPMSTRGEPVFWIPTV
ncbi:MAG: PAAR domain-containing protein [Burkholderiales bacterium]|nr:MAG: PAAR domain-containing protein [Burkholderiales bacterium]